MIWLGFLSLVSFFVTITVNVTVMFRVLPAYRRTKNRAFLLLFFAFLIGTFDTVSDQTLGLERMGAAQHIAYRTVRRFGYIADAFLEAAGLVLLTRSYLQFPESKNPDSAIKNANETTELKDGSEEAAQG